MDIGTLTGRIELEDQMSNVLVAINGFLNGFAGNAEEQFAAVESSADRHLTKASFIGSYFGNVLADITMKAISWGKEVVSNSIMAGARLEQLGVATRFLGQQMGYSGTYIDELAKKIEATGITGIDTRESIQQLLAANIDLSNASKLSSIAQNIQGLSGKTSSEVFQTLTRAIATGNTELLRGIGIQNISLESLKAQNKAATGYTGVLSGAQRSQMILNAVMQEGAKYGGLYAENMNTAGKQASSAERAWSQVSEQLGSIMLPITREVIKAWYELGGAVRDSLSGLNTVVGPVMEAVGSSLKSVITLVGDLKTSFSNAMTPLEEGFVGPMDSSDRFTSTITMVIDTLDRLRVMAIEALRPLAEDVWAAMQPGIKAITDLFFSLWDTLKNVYEAVKPTIMELANAVWSETSSRIRAISEAFSYVATAALFVWNVLKPIVEIIAPPAWKAFSAILGLVESSLGLVWDVMGLIFKAGTAVLGMLNQSELVWKAWSIVVDATSIILRAAFKIVEVGAGAFQWLIDKVREALSLFQTQSTSLPNVESGFKNLDKGGIKPVIVSSEEMAAVLAEDEKRMAAARDESRRLASAHDNLASSTNGAKSAIKALADAQAELAALKTPLTEPQESQIRELQQYPSLSDKDIGALVGVHPAQVKQLEQSDKVADKMNALASVYGFVKGELAGVSGAIDENATVLDENGNTLSFVDREIRAVSNALDESTNSWRDNPEAVKDAEAAEKAYLTFKKNMQKELAALIDEPGKAYLANIKIQNDATAAHEDYVRKQTMETTDYKMFQIERWLEDEQRKIKDSVGNWDEANAALMQQAADRVAALNDATNEEARILAVESQRLSQVFVGPMQETDQSAEKLTDKFKGIAEAFQIAANIGGESFGRINQAIGQVVATSNTLMQTVTKFPSVFGSIAPGGGTGLFMFSAALVGFQMLYQQEQEAAAEQSAIAKNFINTLQQYSEVASRVLGIDVVNSYMAAIRAAKSLEAQQVIINDFMREFEHQQAIRSAAESAVGPSQSQLNDNVAKAKEVLDYVDNAVIQMKDGTSQMEYTAQQRGQAYVNWQKAMAASGNELAKLWLKDHEHDFDGVVKDAEKASKAMEELTKKRESLADSIKDEAPEAVMGVIETQIRGQMAALDKEIEAQKKKEAEGAAAAASAAAEAAANQTEADVTKVATKAKTALSAGFESAASEAATKVVTVLDGAQPAIKAGFSLTADEMKTGFLTAGDVASTGVQASFDAAAQAMQNGLIGAAVNSADGIKSALSDIEVPPIHVKVVLDMPERPEGNGEGEGGGEGAEGMAGGGMVYAARGTYVPMIPRGTDTRPAMLTPGERVLSVSETEAYDRRTFEEKMVDQSVQIGSIQVSMTVDKNVDTDTLERQFLEMLRSRAVVGEAVRVVTRRT